MKIFGNLQWFEGATQKANVNSDGSSSLIPFTDWTPVTFNAGNFTANGSMTWTVEVGDVATYKYSIIGKIMFLQFNLNATTVGGTPNTLLYVAIPGGKTCASETYHYCEVLQISQTGWQVGLVALSPSGSVVNVFRDLSTATNWAANTNATYVRGSIWFPIN